MTGELAWGVVRGSIQSTGRGVELSLDNSEERSCCLPGRGEFSFTRMNMYRARDLAI